jgi:hypothetical protein
MSLIEIKFNKLCMCYNIIIFYLFSTIVSEESTSIWEGEILKKEQHLLEDCINYFAW